MAQPLWDTDVARPATRSCLNVRLVLIHETRRNRAVIDPDE